MIEQDDDEIQTRMRANADRFAALVLQTNQDAAKTIVDASRGFEAEQEILVQRLVGRRVAKAIASPSVKLRVGSSPAALKGDASPSGSFECGRRSARSVMLKVLAETEGPVFGNVLDAAVTAEGWSKAAADKMKSKLKAEGLATNDKRQWTITDAGRHAISG